MGKNVWWPMGFHVTVTPVLAICDAIKRKDPATVVLYSEYVRIYENDESRVQEIIHSFERPENVAAFFSSNISKDMDVMGFSIDWRARFTTMDDAYQRFIQWQFRQLKEKNALVKGKHPVLYSFVDNNAVGEDDIKDGDTDKVAIQNYELVKFPLVKEKAFVVASTLRPETLYGVTNIWINPQVEYVSASVNGETWIVAKEAIEKLKQQGKEIHHVTPVEARSLIHARVSIPLQESRTVPILETSFVSAHKGTGIVYSVPGHAPWDFAALQHAHETDAVAKEITPLYVIHCAGFPRMSEWFASQKSPTLKHPEALQRMTEEIYKKEFYEGVMSPGNGTFSELSVQVAKEKMVEKLVENHAHDVLYEPSRRAFTRAGNPVSVAVLENQWFLNYSSREWKEKTKEWVGTMTIHPEHFRKAIIDAIDWLDKRPCIRKRGLGTPFPFDEEWMIEPLSDSTIYMNYYVISLVLNEEKHVPPLLDGFFSHVLLDLPLPKNDALFSLAEKVKAKMHYWRPNDHGHTAPAHISNHTSFALLTHTLLLPPSFWPKTYTFNEMLVRNGVKMSKSKGNVIPIQHGVKEFGADLIRLFMMSSAGFDRVADWKDNQVPQVQKKLGELESILKRGAQAPVSRVFSEEEEWLSERLKQCLSDAFQAYESMDFMVASQKAFFEPVNEIKRFRKVFG
ncbi:MAG: leucine--tRNA ligase, partial [archaeon]